MSKAKKIPNIDLRPNGEYRVRVKGYAARQFMKLDDATAHRDRLKRARQTGTMADPDADRIKLRDLATEHFAANGDSLATRTFDSYRQQWKAHVLTHHIADMPVRMISPKVVEEFRDDLLTRGVGPTSVRRTLTIMQTVLKRGITHHGLASNPVAVVKKPGGKRAGTIAALSPAQVEAIRQQVKGADAVLLSVLAYSGVRPEEARALTWGDVKPNTLRIDKAAEPDGSVKGTKTDRNRSVRLLKPLADDLAAFRVASGNPSDATLIFPRADGAAWRETDWRNWRARTFRKAADDAGVAIRRPYDLRHSAASLWLYAGVAPIRVAKWMGHSLAKLSDTYAHIIEDIEDENDDARVNPDAAIRKARADIAQDNVRTTLRVLASPSQSTGTTRKPRARRRAGG
jgi:integrase